MRNRVLGVAGLVFLALLTSAWAEGIAGKWTAKAGEADVALVFQVDGNKLTGTLNNSQMPGDVAINDGKIEGDQVSFTITRNMGGNDMKIVWKGKVAGDEIRFTRTVAGQEAPAGGSGPEIVAKRAK